MFSNGQYKKENDKRNGCGESLMLWKSRNYFPTPVQVAQLLCCSGVNKTRRRDHSVKPEPVLSQAKWEQESSA